ncbi:MAG: S-layer protein [Methanomicrobiales archaeon]|nr:S-layer protein [Methanomicrobiales archaeon]
MLMTVGMMAGEAPLSVKSEPQMIGDIPGDTNRLVPFMVQINPDAHAGTYQIPVSLVYTYLWSASSEGTDNIAYYFKTDQKIQNLIIVIRPVVILRVQNISVGYLNAGTEGYLNLTLQNTGSEHAREAVIHIVPNAVTNPLQPTDSAAYIGQFDPGAVVQANFKISADSSAEAYKTYPFNIYCEYVDFEGKTTQSDQVTFGVPVSGKIQFSIVSSPPVIHPGEQKVIEIAYQNTGSESVHDAQVQLSTVSPFTGTDDTAYLGALPQGANGTVKFKVTLDSSATAKTYGIDSEIRYLDALDNPHVSDTIKVPIIVLASPGILESYTLLILIVIIIGIVIGGAYFLRRRRPHQ